MRRGFLNILLLLVSAFFSACTQTYKNNKVIVDPEDSEFLGIHPANFKYSKNNTVILMHGMCSHDETWLPEVTRALRFSAKVNDEPLITGSKTDVNVYKANWQEGENSINFYGIIYSPELNKVKKEYLCSDIDQRNTTTTFCEGPNKYERVRASINNTIKDKLMNDCLADAVIYSGETGIRVRQGVRDALAAIEKDSAKDENAPITLVSQSLGSKVLRDALVCEDEESEEVSGDRYMGNEKSQAEKSINYLSATQQVFLVSNQIALLNRGNSGQCKISENINKQITTMRSANSNLNINLNNNFKSKQNDVFDLFDLISSNKKNLEQSKPDKRTADKSEKEIPFNVVSFTDPNDILSYEVSSREYKNYEVTNVIVSNASTFMGLIANPINAHLGYFANPDVSKYLRFGRGATNSTTCY